MFTLKDLNVKPSPVSPDTQLYTCTGSGLILNEICPVGVSWTESSSDLFEVIADEHDIAYVFHFTINPHDRHRYSANNAKITLKEKDIPDSVYIGGVFCKVKPYIPTPPSCQNC